METIQSQGIIEIGLRCFLELKEQVSISSHRYTLAEVFSGEGVKRMLKIMMNRLDDFQQKKAIVPEGFLLVSTIFIKNISSGFVGNYLIFSY